MKIAIQGFEASFHSIAARQLFGDQHELIFCKTFKQVFETVENDQAEHAIVAIENTLYGSINEVYDLLLKHDFSINQEAYEQIGLHLMALPSANLADITDVYSQTPALGEADAYLLEKLPHAERHEHADTALAAKEVSIWSKKQNAAIASEAAAKTYGLNILARNIETHHKNYTRFIALSKNKVATEIAEKTSIVFQTIDKPGALHEVLGVFAKFGANLTKLESRPIVGSVWQYFYYVDFVCDSHQASLANILSELPVYASKIRLLGSYQKGAIKHI